jgi:hypothetical protein
LSFMTKHYIDKKTPMNPIESTVGFYLYLN